MKRVARPIAELPFDKVLKQARALSELLAPFNLALSAKDRNRRLKMPSKNADAITPLLEIAKGRGLDTYAAPIEDYRRALVRLGELQLVLGEIQLITSGLFMTSESETWKATTTIYTILRRLARSDPRLANLLQPVVAQYFARKRTAAAEPAATVTAPKAKKKAGRRA